MIGTDTPLAHLAAMSDEHGVFEHAKFDRPRREHGYCLDDVARALIVVVREDSRSRIAARLADTYFTFVDSAVGLDGRARNRMDAAGRWTDRLSDGDWWGRAIHALGIAATEASDPALRVGARAAFARGARVRSPYLRSMCFAALGAAAILDSDPQDEGAAVLLSRAVDLLTRSRSRAWDWPEDRLRYANASIPEAFIAAGAVLDDDALVSRGLGLLELLLDIESRHGHLSVTPARGRGPGDVPPAFDQQPIEVAAIAEACTRAFELTGDARWFDAVRSAWGWFEGENDVGAVMFDPETGAGYDGLTPTGRNENRGAESTLAALSTLQCVRRCGEASVTAALVGASGHMRSGEGGRSSSRASERGTES